ncbi:MAG: EamA family transporter [Spirochaetia bacterium]
MSIWVALILITLCALLWDVGIVLQKLAVDRIPSLRLGRRFAAALRSLLTSGRWMAGLAASAIGWGLFAFALAFTPVSVARAIQGSGFVILAVFSLLFLGHRLSAREWIGVGLVTCGIAALGIAETRAGSIHGSIAMERLLPAAAVCLLVCAVAAVLARLRRIGLPGVIVFSLVAGILLGLGDVSTKVLLTALQGNGVGLLAAAVAGGLVVFYVTGFLVLSRAYQQGRAILVTAVSDLCSRLVAIFIGVSALGEAMSGDPWLAAAGYSAILVGAVFLARFSGEQIAEGLAKPRTAGSPERSEPLAQAQKGKSPSPAGVDADD